MTLLINRSIDPKPIFKLSLKFLLLTKSSAPIAPINGPIRIPKNGIMKGPTRRPIVLPQTPALDRRIFESQSYLRYSLLQTTE